MIFKIHFLVLMIMIIMFCLFLNSEVQKCRYSILSCLTAILTTLSTFQVDAYSITGNTAVLDWLKEYSEEKDINKEGATWVEWISDYLLQIVSIDTIDSLSFKETELVGSMIVDDEL